MGMFDSIFADCPNCGHTIEFQSKAGLCELKRYKCYSVPADIAMAFEGYTKGVTCRGCGKEFDLFPEATIPRVKLVIKEVTKKKYGDREVYEAVEDEEEWD